MSAPERRPLRVGIDYLPAVAHVPGAGRYAREFVRGLVGLEERPEIALYEVGRAERTVDEAALGLPPKGSPASARLSRLRSETSRRVLAKSPFRRWRCADVALGGVDVFHHTSKEVPAIAEAAQVVPVAEIPSAGSRDEGLLASALERADAALVFCPSAKKRVRDRFGFAEERIHAVAVGCDHFRRDLGTAIPERETIPRILVVGPLARARRHLRILKAFERLVEDGLTAHLHVVGAGGEDEVDFDRVAQFSRVKLRIAREKELSQRALAELFARSSVLVHLVDDAATAVTPLEAFSFGTAVVASGLPVYQEGLGGLAELVQNPTVDHASDVLADAIERALTSARDPLACAARMRHAAEHTWERNARETVAVWEKIAAERGLRSSRP